MSGDKLEIYTIIDNIIRDMDIVEDNLVEENIENKIKRIQTSFTNRNDIEECKNKFDKAYEIYLTEGRSVETLEYLYTLYDLLEKKVEGFINDVNLYAVEGLGLDNDKRLKSIRDKMDYVRGLDSKGEYKKTIYKIQERLNNIYNIYCKYESYFQKNVKCIIDMVYLSNLIESSQKKISILRECG